MRRSAHGLNEVKRRQYVRKTRRIPVSRIVDVNVEVATDNYLAAVRSITD